ncbi:MAG TPA: hypothetical protein VK545_08160 [Streptomyces sp.]|nr:hypothetical protein [Streptomyces sp.]
MATRGTFPPLETALAAAAAAGPTEGDKLRAALDAYGVPSFPAGGVSDGGVTYVLVAVDQTRDEDAAHTGPRLHIAFGEDANRPAADHDEPWTVHLYTAGGDWEAALFTAPGGLDVDEESAITAWFLVRWLRDNAHRYPRP